MKNKKNINLNDLILLTNKKKAKEISLEINNNVVYFSGNEKSKPKNKLTENKETENKTNEKQDNSSETDKKNIDAFTAYNEIMSKLYELDMHYDKFFSSVHSIMKITETFEKKFADLENRVSAIEKRLKKN